jgi:hypothetical protein
LLYWFLKANGFGCRLRLYRLLLRLCQVSDCERCQVYGLGLLRVPAVYEQLLIIDHPCLACVAVRAHIQAVRVVYVLHSDMRITVMPDLSPGLLYESLSKNVSQVLFEACHITLTLSL